MNYVVLDFETTGLDYKENQVTEVTYFNIFREVPATESQEGMDLMFEFYEVEPKVIAKTVYTRRKLNEK